MPIHQTLAANTLKRYAGAFRVSSLAIVVAEVKFFDVSFQVLASNVVKRTNKATFQDAEKPFNRIRVSVAAHVFLGTMFDRLMARKFLADWLIESQLVSH